MNPKTAYIGFDCETTGISPHAPENAGLLEIGMIAYDADLTELDAFSSLVRSPAATAHRAAGVGDFITDLHTDNGLFADLDAAEEPLELGDVEASALDFMETYSGWGTPPMLGSSITLDRVFLAAEMPRLLSKFHYRSVDATSLAQAAAITAGIDLAGLYSHSRAAHAHAWANPGMSLVDAAKATRPNDDVETPAAGSGAHRVLYDIRHSAALIAVTLHHLRGRDN